MFDIYRYIDELKFFKRNRFLFLLLSLYRSEIKQPTTEEITQRLYDNPYIKFNDYQSEQTTHI